MNDPAVVGNGLAALALADQWFSGETSNLKLRTSLCSASQSSYG